MSPSTNPAQDAFKVTRPGWWTCYLCSPPVHDRGGMKDWRAHYMREHWVEVKP